MRYDLEVTSTCELPGEARVAESGEENGELFAAERPELTVVVEPVRFVCIVNAGAR